MLRLVWALLTTSLHGGLVLRSDSSFEVLGRMHSEGDFDGWSEQKLKAAEAVWE